MARVADLLSRHLRGYARDDRGAVILLFGLCLPVIAAMVFIVIDYGRATSVRSELQSSLDSATLYAARSEAKNAAELQEAGMRMLRANMANARHGSLLEATFTIDADQKVTATAKATVPMSTALLGRDALEVGATAEVVRSSNNIEVGLALDITGSMSGQRLTDLKAAAKELVDLVVKDQQTPHYSKVALVPYSNAVNVGSNADTVRGVLTNNTCDSPSSPTCKQYRFYNVDGNRVTYNATSCVTERPGTNAYTDASPSTAKLSPYYVGTASGDGNYCPASQIVPLSANRTTLKDSINTYIAKGSTAGHIGLAWAWYMISPNFASLFSGTGKAAAYDAKDLIKVVILMTDGEFNTAYYNGVLAKNSSFGSNSIRINSNATNGSSTDQAKSLCTAIKAKGVILYTVGFNVSNSSKTFLTNCATSSSHVYLPSSGTALKDAFRAIAQEISSLRISK